MAADLWHTLQFGVELALLYFAICCFEAAYIAWKEPHHDR